MNIDELYFLCNSIDAIRKEHGKNLAEILCITKKNNINFSNLINYFHSTLNDNKIKKISDKIKNLENNSEDIYEYCLNILKNKFLGIFFKNYFLGILHKFLKNYKLSLNFLKIAYDSILECYKEYYVWLFPVIKKFSNDLRLYAIEYDIILKSNDNSFLRDIEVTIKKSLTLCLKDRLNIHEPMSRKKALFSIANVLLKIYFKMNSPRLCQTLTSQIEGRSGGNIMKKENLFAYPISDVVTYKYYVGRLKILEDNFDDARDCLIEALKYTPLNEVKNRQRILIMLIPIQINFGILPKKIILKKYQLYEYIKLSHCIKNGNIHEFDKIISLNQFTFIRLGVYMVFEQIRVLCYRNLFKKVYFLRNDFLNNNNNNNNISSNHLLPLSLFNNILIDIGEDTDMDEIECILSNLIFHRKLKGYISHERRMLVTAKNANPFPNWC